MYILQHIFSGRDTGGDVISLTWEKSSYLHLKGREQWAQCVNGQSVIPVLRMCGILWSLAQNSKQRLYDFNGETGIVKEYFVTSFSVKDMTFQIFENISSTEI